MYPSLEAIPFEDLRFFEIFLGVDSLLVFWLDTDVSCFSASELASSFLEGVESGIGSSSGKCSVESV